ncbi:S8 family serine peptidase [Cohnella sp. GCM10020058]|uniref:S8 family serine peptidase n=1 Tax=Cohnella sp. GCM10020058 TaxID=3317330 RepID=UPI00363FDC9A
MTYGKVRKVLIFIVIALCILTSGQPGSRNYSPSGPNTAEAQKWATINDYYRVSELHKRGYTGSGVHVAIVTFDTFELADIEIFSKRFNLPIPTVNVIPLFGGAVHQGASAIGHVESTLDIDVVHAAAPDAVIDVYSVPPAVPFNLVLQKILDDGQARIVTFSWGRAPNPQDDELSYAIIEEMGRRGTTVFAYTGDNGPSDDNSSVASPSYFPNVVAVGGTVITADPASKRVFEREWPLSVGGWSAYYPSPGYQSAAAASLKGKPESGKYRMLPDIVGPSIVTAAGSPTADKDGPPIFVTDPKTGEGSWLPATGTSVAAPYMAGIFANIAGGLQRGLGDIHETLYGLMGQPAFNRVDSSSEEAVVEGGDSYSMTAGLGSVNALEMAAAFGLMK